MPIKIGGGKTTPSIESKFWKKDEVDRLFPTGFEDYQNYLKEKEASLDNAIAKLDDGINKIYQINEDLKNNSLYLGNYDGKDSDKSYQDLAEAVSGLNSCQEALTHIYEAEDEVNDLKSQLDLTDGINFISNPVYSQLDPSIKDRYDAQEKKANKKKKRQKRKQRFRKIMAIISIVISIFHIFTPFHITYLQDPKVDSKTLVEFFRYCIEHYRDMVLGFLGLSMGWLIIGSFWIIGSYVAKKKYSKCSSLPSYWSIKDEIVSYITSTYSQKVEESINPLIEKADETLDRIDKFSLPLGMLNKYFDYKYFPHLHSAIAYINSGRSKTLNELLDRLDRDIFEAEQISRQELHNKLMEELAREGNEEQKKANARLEAQNEKILQATQEAAKAQQDAAFYARMSAREAEKQTEIANTQARDTARINKELQKSNSKLHDIWSDNHN